jgi:hypothetical protein
VVRAAVGFKTIHLTVSRRHVHSVHPLHVHWLSRISRVLDRTRWTGRRHLAWLRRRVHV